MRSSAGLLHDKSGVGQYKRMGKSRRDERNYRVKSRTVRSSPMVKREDPSGDLQNEREDQFEAQREEGSFY